MVREVSVVRESRIVYEVMEDKMSESRLLCKLHRSKGNTSTYCYTAYG